MSQVILLLAGLVALLVGLGLLLVPRLFFASYGFELGDQPSLLSEIRAPGGLLVVLAFVLLQGSLFEEHRRRAAWLGALFYLSYAGARLLSIVLDGLPHLHLLYAAAGELVLGAACGTVYCSWIYAKSDARRFRRKESTT